MTAGRLEFSILGPLAVRVDGKPIPVGGPKQRALLALLLLSANRVVARERLIAELFAEQSMNSADHALRNHVSRLRKLLSPVGAGEPRLVARAPGYLLRVEPGELDLEHFEQLASEGHEALATGDARAAADALRVADRLWQGRPLADLELEKFARVEVDRLEEMRLAAVEERIDAELALGGHLALVPELDALTAEHPYRERFRAQLMLALYRCGRQADGLEVYRRTRALLSDELGLEPGVELQELERAILVHDPALALTVESPRTGRSLPSSACPFKGLAPFDVADAELFFGRERLVDELLSRLADSQVLALVGPSGSGKTSLIRAGLLPVLPGDSMLVRPTAGAGRDLSAALERVAPGERLVVVVDQLEELFGASVHADERHSFVEAVVDAAWDPERRALIVIGLRADFFGHLAPYVELADLVSPNHALLGPMTAGELRRAIEGPAAQAGLDVEHELVDALVDDISGEPGGLPLLSTALLDLWSEREGRSLTLAAYEQTGGVRRAVGRHAEAAFRSLEAPDREVARRLFLRLVDGGDGEPLTRRRVLRAELDADEDSQVADVLETLVDRRLLVADDGTVELVHEALLEHWPRLADWLEEDTQGRRVHRHLTEAAADWETGGRDPGELYRGARLAAALGWADANGQAGLNRVEREFLDESRAAHTRTHRRLQALLAVAVLLLAAAVLAGGFAIVARGSATRQATAATAQRLGAQALVEPTLDRSLLLAREGVALDDSTATRSNLLAALLRSPAALAVLHGGGTSVVDDAVAPDGHLFVTRSDDGRVSFFDPRTLRTIGPTLQAPGQISFFGAVVLPKRAMAFSPDGRTVAVGDSDGAHATLSFVDARTHRVRAKIASPVNMVTADVSFAPDGRTLVTGEAVSGRFLPAPEVLVLRRASDGRALAHSKPIVDGRLIGFTRGGRLVFATGEHMSYLLDARTLMPVRMFRASGAAALSANGGEAALGQDDGSVSLLDLRTGSLRTLTRRGAAPVTAVAFGPDGKTLAAASAGGGIDVWDIPTQTLRETFAGHAGAAYGLLFSADGATLYSASSDASVIVWDIRGGRRLGRPFRFAPTPAAGEGLHTPPPKGANSSVAMSPDGRFFATTPAPNRVTIWRLHDLRVVAELRGPCGAVSSLVYSHDGRFFACVGSARRAVVWSVATRSVVKLIGQKAPSALVDVGFSDDDTLLATVDDTGDLRVYDARSGRPVARIRMKGSPQALDFSPDGKLLAAGALSGDVAVWNIARTSLERTIHDPNAVQSVRFAPNGKEIATGELTGNVEFWDPATGRRLGRTLGGQNGDVVGVVFNPSGTELLTTSTDGKLRLWDLPSGKLVGAPLPGSATGGWANFTPDGRQVVAAFWSGTGVVWNVDPEAWKAQACRIAHRNLTRAEWQDFLPGRRYRRACP